jgi:hypothetical protein
MDRNLNRVIAANASTVRWSSAGFPLRVASRHSYRRRPMERPITWAPGVEPRPSVSASLSVGVLRDANQTGAEHVATLKCGGDSMVGATGALLASETRRRIHAHGGDAAQLVGVGLLEADEIDGYQQVIGLTARERAMAKRAHGWQRRLKRWYHNRWRYCWIGRNV